MGAAVVLPFEERYVTLFADASFCSDTGAYGWCFWVKHGNPARTYTHSGGGVGMQSSEKAEIEALNQGIEWILLNINLQHRFVVIQSDCVAALNKVDRSKLTREGNAAKAYTKHVRGHQGGGTPRSAVNELCDRLAKEHMRKHRPKR